MPQPLRDLRRKFAHALRGLGVAVAGRNGFAYHGAATLVVAAVSLQAGVSPAEWLMITLCVTLVVAAELANTAVEHLAKAVTTERRPEVRDALDVAAGAVLAACLGAAVVWLAILWRRLALDV